LNTVPAYDASKSQWLEPNVICCPFTVSLLRRIAGPFLRTALFSRLGPHTQLHVHTGWADLANYVLRCHLPLVIPKARDSCGLWVEGEVRFHTPGDILVFDDSKYHKAFNDSNEERVVLIIDLLRPDTIPRGTAAEGHTEQLETFINDYRASLYR
jgi:ornithine lipid ester-linked acyl 2-hydroxylase